MNETTSSENLAGFVIIRVPLVVSAMTARLGVLLLKHSRVSSSRYIRSSARVRTQRGM